MPVVRDRPGNRQTFVDAIGQEIRLDGYPQRVVSLIPSLTETLFALGLGDRLIGVTRYCKYPEQEVATRVKIGGVQDIEIGALLSLRPDLVLADLEENRQEELEPLRGRVAVFWTFARTIPEVERWILTLGDMLGLSEKASSLVQEIEAAREKAHQCWLGRRPLRLFYPVWYEPFISINGDTYINEVLEICGAQNVFADKESRYCQVTMEEIVERDPEVILLPSEPFAFQEQHRREFYNHPEIAAVRDSRVYLVDGEMVCWWGVRMIRGLPYLCSLLWQGP